MKRRQSSSLTTKLNTNPEKKVRPGWERGRNYTSMSNRQRMDKAGNQKVHPRHRRQRGRPRNPREVAS